MDNTWTHERTERMKKMWNDGRSASQIGRELGMTRNAVLGKRHRLQLDGRRPAYPAADPHLRAKLYAERRNAGKVLRRKQTAVMISTAPQEPAPPLVPRSGVIPTLNIPFMDIGYDQCREITGEGDDRLAIYCGHTVVNGSSYCPFHHRINYQPMKFRGRSTRESV
jgi:GcrA cell cycle regulator